MLARRRSRSRAARRRPRPRGAREARGWSEARVGPLMRRRPTGEPCKAKTDALGRAGRRAAGAGAPAAARAAKWAARGRARKCRAGVGATGGLEWACVWRQAPCVGWSARTGGRVRMGDSRVRMARRPRPALGRRASTPPGRGRREALVLGRPVTCRHLLGRRLVLGRPVAGVRHPAAVTGVGHSRVSGIHGCRAQAARVERRGYKTAADG